MSRLQAQDEEIHRLKRLALEADVAKIMTTAENYRDETGRGHSPVLLEASRNVLLGQDIQMGENKVIKLESSNTSDIIKYTRTFVEALLTDLPGQVKFKSDENLPTNAKFDQNSLEPK